MTDLRDLSYEQLNALIRSRELKNFDAAMLEADSPLTIYIELRRSRGILDSEELQENHQDIIALTKSAVVFSFSALDALVHAVLQRDIAIDLFEKVRYKTFQSSTQIETALGHLSITNGFSSIASHISFDLYTESRVRADLDAFYDRKNYITHHADFDGHGNKLMFTPVYALSCTPSFEHSDMHSIQYRFASNNSFRPTRLSGAA